MPILFVFFLKISKMDQILTPGPVSYDNNTPKNTKIFQISEATEHKLVFFFQVLVVQNQLDSPSAFKKT